jgi:DNA-binding transcriptional LysR family regulator
MLINQELLRTFVAAAEARTFAEAAARRHVTKSAVSQQLKILEAQLGVSLFERVGRQAVLTDSGGRLARLLRREFEVIDDALEALRNDRREVRGEVRLGAPRPFARVWLRPRLTRLLASHDALRARVLFGTPSELEKMLLDRTLDFAVLVRPPEASTLVARAIYRERFAAYGTPDYLRTRGTPRVAADFQGHRWIAFDEDFPMQSAWWRAMFGPRSPMKGEVACFVASLDEMLALAEQGVGLTVLPEYFVADALATSTVVEIPIARRDRRVYNEIYLTWRHSAVSTARFDAVRAALLESDHPSPVEDRGRRRGPAVIPSKREGAGSHSGNRETT